jgi:hypothetical protein
MRSCLFLKKKERKKERGRGGRGKGEGEGKWGATGISAVLNSWVETPLRIG